MLQFADENLWFAFGWFS